jgi:hypothetical protein
MLGQVPLASQVAAEVRAREPAPGSEAGGAGQVMERATLAVKLAPLAQVAVAPQVLLVGWLLIWPLVQVKPLVWAQAP